MNYFMSDIHGASNAYFQIKKNIGLKNNDELFILGDIFDGNDNAPEECLKILDDIINSNNIHLLLGDHEYAHVMYFVTRDNEEAVKEWQTYITSPQIKGSPLLHYMYSNITDKERTKYMEYLIQCDLSELIKIGSRYFYLVHGSPCVCKNGNAFQWQKDVSTGIMNIKYNYIMALKSDPGIEIPKEINKNDYYILSGHTPNSYYFEQNDSLLQKYYPQKEEMKNLRIIMENKKFLINCNNENYHQNTNLWIPNLACVAIDAAGFFVEYAQLKI